MAKVQQDPRRCPRCGKIRKPERMSVDSGMSKPSVTYCTCGYPYGGPNLVITPPASS